MKSATEKCEVLITKVPFRLSGGPEGREEGRRDRLDQSFPTDDLETFISCPSSNQAKNREKKKLSVPGVTSFFGGLAVLPALAFYQFLGKPKGAKS